MQCVCVDLFLYECMSLFDSVFVCLCLTHTSKNTLRLNFLLMYALSHWLLFTLVEIIKRVNILVLQWWRLLQCNNDLPQNYPNSPPSIRFTSEIGHRNGKLRYLTNINLLY